MSGESVQFGPYELVRRIGAGGMAETFLGVRRGPAGFEQRVCLKRILSAYESDAELVEMFLAEARVSASLRHANITQVIDFGEAEGLHYLALEMIDGMDLRGLVKAMTAAGERLAPGLVTHLATGLGAALAHAHAQGVVHRDVSPSNVLVSRAGEVKLTDFGIAKAKSVPDMTATGVVKGKVPYMAPEYATSGKIDPRGDLFSLGVTLFECLTGGPRPYDGATDLETLGKSTTGEHAPLWQAAPHATPVLAAAIERLIKPDPAARFATAGELLDALAAEPAPASAARDLEALVRRYEKAPPPSSFSLPPSRSRQSAPQPAPARSSGRLVVSLIAAAAVLIGVVIGLVVASPGSGPDRAEVDRPIASAPSALTTGADDAGGGNGGSGPVGITDGGPPPDPAEAARQLERSCQGGEAAACTRLGFMVVRGEGVTRDDARAATLFRRGCDGGDAWGCSDLGTLHASGRGVPLDLEAARRYFEQGCEGGYVLACSNLGTVYERGLGVDRDLERARALFERACDADSRCVNLGLLYRNGTGVPRDVERAASLFDRACTRGEHVACAHLGALHEEGSGVPRDATRAVELYRRACDGGAPSGCAFLGNAYLNGTGVAPDILEAAQLYESACDQASETACHNLGVLFYEGRGVARDHARAATLFRRACELGHQPACAAGRRVREPREPRPSKVVLNSLDQARLAGFSRLAQGCAGTARRLTGNPVTQTTAVFDVAPGGFFQNVRFQPPIPDELRRCIMMRGGQFQFSPQPEAHVERVRLTLQ